MNKNLEQSLSDGNRPQYRFMKYRIHKILLVCCGYDGYILEEDGHIESQINQEYLDLNMSNPPSFTRVSSTREALDLLGRDDSFDFILTMYNVGELDVFTFAKIVKERHPQIPVALLTSFSKDIYRRIEEQDRSGLDYIFGWHGNTDLIMAIIKLVEDKMNAEEDIVEGGVQAILLVEDSIRFYSTYLPELYKLILQQNTEFLKDAFNEQQQILRKRARPKILLATNYEEAVELYDRYKKNMLGVISDVGFVLHRNDPPESEKRDAGIDLCRRIKEDNPLMPVLLQSSQTEFEAQARGLGAGFIAKNSKTLLSQLHEYIAKEFAFGDFLFKDPDTGAVIGRAKDLAQMQEMIATIPDKAFEYHTSQNHLSKWLYSRGLFPLAAAIRRGNKSQFATTEEHRQRIVNLIKDYRILLGQGVVARFDTETYSDAVAFARIGEGSLGGKARGLAFMNSMLLKHRQYDKHDNLRIMIPRSVVIATDYFDEFIRNNGLKYIISQEFSDEEILSEFVSSTIPVKLQRELKAYIKTVSTPLAVRSSSKLEDSHYQPFAGIYSTYMIPYVDNEDQMLRLLLKAVKSVYASVYFASSRAYLSSSQNLISEEKMAVIIQEVCGTEQNGLFFPTFSGVARSINYYPIGDEAPEDGVCNVAMGLGKLVVDGGRTLRFSPRYPQKVLQTSTPELALRDTQNEVLALSLQPEEFRTSIDDAVNLRQLDIAQIAESAQFALRLLGVGPRERAHLGQPLRPGPQSHNIQQHTEIQHLPAGGDRHRHPAHGRRGDALPRGGRIRRQYGRGAGGTADFQPAADPPDHRQSGQPADRLERSGHLRCAGLRRERPRHRHDERHLGRHLHQKRHVQFAFDRENRRRTAGAEPPHARRKTLLHPRRSRPLGFVGSVPRRTRQVEPHLRSQGDRRMRHREIRRRAVAGHALLPERHLAGRRLPDDQPLPRRRRIPRRGARQMRRDLRRQLPAAGAFRASAVGLHRRPLEQRHRQRDAGRSAGEIARSAPIRHFPEKRRNK
ncbi:MAG: PEP/pyruvate-binding domain-containing protein [Alistipes finegoldii]